MEGAAMIPSGNDEKKLPGLRLMERDFEILLALHAKRYMTTDQLLKLFWRESKGGTWGRIKACQQRLRLLALHNIIRRIQLPVRRGDKPRPYVYTLAEVGAALLSSEIGIDPRDIDWKPKPQEENFPYLTHLLTTTSFHISLQQDCDALGIILEEWLDEKELKSVHNTDYVTLVSPQGGSSRAAVCPDAYFRLCRNEKRAICFVEIDLASVTIAPTVWERRGWLRKIRTYVVYGQSEAYRTRYEGRLARVLTVTSSNVRLQNLKRATEAVFEEMRRAGEDTSAQTQFWFTIFSEDLPPTQLLTAPIWQVAGSTTLRALLE
jgi:hypothetical protein